MRKMKKINSYLIIRFNAKEMKEWGPELGEYGVINEELYTGHLDVDKNVLEYAGIDNINKAIEKAKSLIADSTKNNDLQVKEAETVNAQEKTVNVMEYVIGIEHIFDILVRYTAPNGKVKAVQPKLVVWWDMKSRCILGDVICVDANSQTLKESLEKMTYSQSGGIPKILHIDNGKDYTGEIMTGRNRKKQSFDFDSETVGDKFSRWFESYIGTLTGSEFYGNNYQDAQKILESEELLTLEEFYKIWTNWKDNIYHKSLGESLKSK